MNKKKKFGAVAFPFFLFMNMISKTKHAAEKRDKPWRKREKK